MHLFVDSLVNVAVHLVVENGETVPSAVTKALALLSDSSKKGETEIAGEVSKGLFLKQKHSPFARDWTAYRRLSDDKKLALLVSRAVSHRQLE